MEKLTKILGGVLLIGGIVLIGWTIFQSYQVFTGKAPAPVIFQEQETQAKIQTKTATPEGDIQGQIQQMLGDQLKGLLPSDTVPKMLNLSIWGMLAWVLFLGAGKISDLGIKLLKK